MQLIKIIRSRIISKYNTVAIKDQSLTGFFFVAEDIRLKHGGMCREATTPNLVSEDDALPLHFEFNNISGSLWMRWPSDNEG